MGQSYEVRRTQDKKRTRAVFWKEGKEIRWGSHLCWKNSLTSHVGQLLSPQGTVKYVTEREGGGVGWGGGHKAGNINYKLS